MMFRLTVVCCVMIWLSGCSTTPHHVPATRAFNFQSDTFAFANELKRVYHVDPITGTQTSTRQIPPAEYSLHCFVVARTARQFFDHARFDPKLPLADETTYHHLIQQVLQRSLRQESAEADKIVIPGYANLRDFSRTNEYLLKHDCGGAWQSYVQRGHWRMVFPFSTRNQKKMAEQMLAEMQLKRPLIVHVVRFPQLTINHAMMLFKATETESEIIFDTYDPNDAQQPTTLVFHRYTGRFELPVNRYFHGGRVDVYEIYRNAFY